jgi:TorA maturation chaperone TorD
MPIEQAEYWKDVFVGETLIFGLLGRALYKQPDRMWLEALIREDIFSEAPFGTGEVDVERGLSLLQSWAAANAGGLAEPEFEVIAKDYLYLFSGAGKPLAPAWESVYFSEERLLFQERTLQVRHWYERFGLQAELQGHEPDDHIGLELNFLAYLSSLALRALESGDTAAVKENLKAQEDFLTQHLSQWVPAWADLVQKHAQTDFYRGIAYLAQGTVQAVAKLLKSGLN